MDVKGMLGLPPGAPDEVVERRIAELKAGALGNLAGPPGWNGIAEDGRAVVYESFNDTSIETVVGEAEFEGQVESVTISRAGTGTRLQARVVRDGVPIDPTASGDPTIDDVLMGYTRECPLCHEVGPNGHTDGRKHCEDEGGPA